ncbi:MAG: cytochrome c oxidase subunit 4 [Thermoleophilaceae bacterium]|nr:cytochrome c oxidase subunit 4 [Thermoleophilaceae bacterium]
MADEIHHNGDEAPAAGEPVHLPGPSYLPVVTAAGLTLALTGIVINWVMVGVGVIITVWAIVRWIRDTRADIGELPLEH